MGLTCDEITERTAPDRVALKEAFAKHYKAERDRSEKCLGEILAIISGAASDRDKLKSVAQAMIDHYSRS